MTMLWTSDSGNLLGRRDLQFALWTGRQRTDQYRWPQAVLVEQGLVVG